jgi:replicative DNA helicase
MPSFDYTVDLERALLRLMTSSTMICRMFIHRLTENMFSSLERKFILVIALDVFNKTKTHLTRKVFEYEVGSRVPENDAVYFIGEWDYIENLSVQETPEILIEKLKEANVGRQVLQLGQELVSFLEAGQILEAVKHLKHTSVNIGLTRGDKPVIELTDYEGRKNLILDKRINPEKYLGIKTGFATFDRYTGGLFRGELTLFAGITGVGKSTFVKQLEKGIVTLNGDKNVLHIANEEYLEQVQHKFDANFTDIPYLDFKLARITDEDLTRWEEFMKNWKHGKIFLKEVPAFTDVTLIEQAYEELNNKGFHIDTIVIDHLPHIKSIQQAWNENDELKKASADCKELARSLHVPVVTPTQAATAVAEKQEKGKRAGQLDVFGSKGQVHVANTFVIITEQGKDNEQTDREEWERDVFWLCDCKKNRDGSRFWFRAKHYVRTGKIEEIVDPNAKQMTPLVPVNTTIPAKASADAAASNAPTTLNKNTAEAKEVLGEALGEGKSGAPETPESFGIPDAIVVPDTLPVQEQKLVVPGDIIQGFLARRKKFKISSS